MSVEPEKNDQYFLLLGDQESGPFSREEIANQVRGGELDPCTLCASLGDSQWAPVGKLLAPEATAAASPPATAADEKAALMGDGMKAALVAGTVIFFAALVVLAFGEWMESPARIAKNYLKKEVVGLKEILELRPSQSQYGDSIVTAKVDVINKAGGIERRFIVLLIKDDGTVKEDLAAAEEEARKDALKKLETLYESVKQSESR